MRAEDAKRWRPGLRLALCVVCDDCETDLLQLSGGYETFPVDSLLSRLVTLAREAHAPVCPKRIPVTLETRPDVFETACYRCRKELRIRAVTCDSCAPLDADDSAMLNRARGLPPPIEKETRVCDRSVACDLPLGHKVPCLPWCGNNGCTLKPKHEGICLDAKSRAVSHIHGCGLPPLHEGPCETTGDPDDGCRACGL